MQVIEFLFGVALVLTVFADVFGSVLVPRPAHSRIRVGPATARGLSPLWHRVSLLIRSPRLRQDFRGGLAPMILVVSGAGWIGGLAVGFALMLQALPRDVHLPTIGFGEALFQSTLALSTLGLVNSSVHGAARAVVALAGLSGFSVLTLLVAFLLSIQTALHQRETLVLTFAARAGRPPTATALLTALPDVCDDELAAYFARWEDWTAQVLQSHLSYPVLCRFRSLDESAEWLLCLAAVLAAGAAGVAAAPDNLPRARRAAGFFNATAARAVREFARVQQTAEQRTGLDEASIHAVVRALARAGIAPVTNGFGERLEAIRAGYAGRLPAIAERLDILWHDPLTGGTGAGLR